MKEIELLAPAGDLDICKAALNAGADAVYLAGNHFGARAFAKNFSDNEIVEAVNYAHLLDKKIFVTVNTLVFDDELEELEQYLDFLYLNNVDGIIVQDLGVMHLMLKKYPNMEVHCSTQMHIHNLAGVQEMKKQGVDRIVIARETPIELIKAMCLEDIDIEVFIHGALCVSYSGQCNFSFQDNGRSANRGACIQNCRWKYRLLKDSVPIDHEEKHYLSMKDLNTLNNIDSLIDAGVKSFKIEGRMKSIDYVVNTVRAYREQIDHKQYHDNLEKSYNRSFTQGHIFHDHDLINLDQSEYEGEYIGKVLSYSEGMATVRLYEDINYNDGLRVVDGDHKRGFIVNNMYHHDVLCKTAHKGDTVQLFSKDRISGKLFRTSNAIEVSKAEGYVEDHIPKTTVDMTLTAHVGEPLTLVLNNGKYEVKCEGVLVDEALSQPTSAERIKTQLSKINDTLFVVGKIEMDLSKNIFISIKRLNELRRKTIKALEDEKIHHTERVIKKVSFDEKRPCGQTQDYLIEVRRQEQFDYLSQLGLKNIVFNDNLKGAIYNSGTINEESNYLASERMILNELGQLSVRVKEKYAGLGVHITNRYTLDFLVKNQVCAGIVSNEISDANFEVLSQYAQDVGFTLYRQTYGKIELMNMKQCPINPKRNQCDMCRKHTYALKHDEDTYHMIGDQACIVTLFSPQPLRKEPLKTNNYIYFTDEKSDEMRNVLNEYMIV